METPIVNRIEITEAMLAEGRQLARRFIDNDEGLNLQTRFFLGPEIWDDGNMCIVYFLPDPKGSRLLVPEKLNGSPYLRFYSGLAQHENAVRFCLGREDSWLVRVARSTDPAHPGLMLHLPGQEADGYQPVPEAMRWVHWFDYKAT